MAIAEVDWKALLTACTKKDFRSAVDGVVHALDKQTRLDPGKFDVRSLAQAVESSLQSKDPQQVLIGCVVLLAVLESALPLQVLASLSQDSLLTGLSSPLTCSAPIIAATAVRCLCSLSAVFLVSSSSDMQRHMRKVVQLLQAAADAHPRSLLVQEAVAQGYCMIVAEDCSLPADSAGAIWAILWPLALHRRDEISRAAVTALCCLVGNSGTGKSFRGVARPGQESAQDMSDALSRAREEFCQCFRLWDPADAEKDLVEIDMRCARLLDLIRSLVLCGQCARQDHTNREAASLHVSKLVNIVEQVFRVAFPESVPSAGNTGESLDIGEARLPVQTLTSTLGLAAALTDVVGVMLLPHSHCFRRWLKTLFSTSSAIRDRFCLSIERLFLALASSAPAVLISAPLLQHIAESSLETLRGIGFSRTMIQESTGAQTHGKRKRKSTETFLASSEQTSARKLQRSHDSLDSAKVAFSILAKMLTLAAPLLSTRITESLCQQMVQILWFGVMAPLPLNTKHADDTAIASSDAHRAAVCRRLCRDIVAAPSLLDVVEALHQPPRAGAIPIASNLVDTFATLLAAMAVIHHRRAPKQITSSTPCWRDVSDGSVRLRCLSLRSSLLSRSARVAPCTAKRFNGDSLVPTDVAISWPSNLSVADDGEQSLEEECPTSLPAELDEKLPMQTTEKQPEPNVTLPSIDTIEQGLQQSQLPEDHVPTKLQPYAQDDAGSVIGAFLEGTTEPISSTNLDNAQESEAAPMRLLEKAPASESVAMNLGSVQRQEVHRVVSTAASAGPPALRPKITTPVEEKPTISLEDDDLLADMMPDLYEGDVGDASPIPELCMDSPDSDEMDL